jgi:hypothetical protein
MTHGHCWKVAKARCELLPAAFKLPSDDHLKLLKPLHASTSLKTSTLKTSNAATTDTKLEEPRLLV